MIRDKIIKSLQSIAPVVTQVTGTSDMGFEFSAIVPNGVIYAEPGMLLNLSGGEWPPDEWQDKSDEEFQMLLRHFLLEETWRVHAWDTLSDEDLEQWLEDAKNVEDEKLEGEE
jgi:hypothetical protein